MQVIIHIDGGARGNPGPAGAGVVICSAEDGTVLRQVGVFLGKATNNVAEYSGLVEALKQAQALGATDVEIRSDSQLLVRQMTGEYRVKNEGLKPLFEKASDFACTFKKFHISHVRREQNTEADRLANRAMDLKRDIEE